jgi:hypothetical protein
MAGMPKTLLFLIQTGLLLFAAEDADPCRVALARTNQPVITVIDGTRKELPAAGFSGGVKEVTLLIDGKKIRAIEKEIPNTRPERLAFATGFAEAASQMGYAPKYLGQVDVRKEDGTRVKRIYTAPFAESYHVQTNEKGEPLIGDRASVVGERFAGNLKVLQEIEQRKEEIARVHPDPIYQNFMYALVRTPEGKQGVLVQAIDWDYPLEALAPPAKRNPFDRTNGRENSFRGGAQENKVIQMGDKLGLLQNQVKNLGGVSVPVKVIEP